MCPTSHYSCSQMHDFYSALANGEVRVSGIMNYIQHLLIAQRCPSEACILDVCCGRALLLPLLSRYTVRVKLYVGVDISRDNLTEADSSFARFECLPPSFPYGFVQADVCDLSSLRLGRFDVIAYTSAIEHMSRINAIRSLEEVARLLKREGVLYLSTPNTPRTSPPSLQYSVHIYEWEHTDLVRELWRAGLDVVQAIGLLPPAPDVLLGKIRDELGDRAWSTFAGLQELLPNAFFDPIAAAGFPAISREVLYICKRVQT